MKWFREALPYINEHKNKTFIVSLPKISNNEFALQVMQELLLLNSLQINLVIISHNNIDHLAQIDKTKADLLLQEINQETLIIKSLFNSARRSFYKNLQTNVILGNFVITKPQGMHAGIDSLYRGLVRKIDVMNIKLNLHANNIVLIEPCGFSIFGDAYILDNINLAKHIGIAIKAEKILFFSNDFNAQQKSSFTVDEAKTLSFSENIIKHSIDAINQGVNRVHLIPIEKDALLEELFTQNGSGIVIQKNNLEKIRWASDADIEQIISLLDPLVASGNLVARTKSEIIKDINNFAIIERERKIIATAMLKIIPESSFGEFCALAVDENCRGGSLADDLLYFIIDAAKNKRLTDIIALTTKTEHWFLERGFLLTDVDKLPQSRKASYNFERMSKILHKRII